MGFYQFKRTQHFNHSRDELWNFISSPRNLKIITPDYMGFDIISDDLPEKMYEGMMIAYKVSPLWGIKTTWVTEITHIKDQHYFVDEQRVGPYKVWHHQHFLEVTPQGTLMKDIVSYQPPFGFIGGIVNKLIIKKKLEEIFTYREKILKQVF
ncbi:MAG: SRPBCC family protein [Salinivirgaceae bacterium]|jgi:ligand-binding SRPBCC domain-containing protein|nr:SRPBCC family protein [Salinivirgaceae bacterium]